MNDQPLPASGGSYIRNPDGSLTLEQPIDAATPAVIDVAVAPPEPAIAVKTAKTVKEV